ncbi:THAP domain-containing protein 5-like isoform X2 [Pararge aegeria]|uniref:THAP domain-containing protein 5-like isoform X2 n=1 Tax=Pararge aegeria TaxID=116150 RepID=UPI0019CF8213|nr:THAP domain-containing protein 5-like isoform X2 [Pararge aegeria]
MVYCAVQSCKNTSAKLKKDKHGITFHRFPQDTDRRRQWEISVNRGNKWSSTKCSVVCSEHFDAQDFYLTESGLRRLCINAVPSINISICQSPAPTISNIPIVDIKPTDTEEVIQLKFKVRRLEVIAENRKRRLYLLWQGRKRMRTKLDNMKNIIKHLISASQLLPEHNSEDFINPDFGHSK